VVGGEKGPDKAWEGRPPSRYFSWASVLSLALCSEREDRQSSRAWGEVWRRGVEWRALSGSGFGLRFYPVTVLPELGGRLITRLARDGGVLRCGIVDFVYQR
jgi:hypothetical protein